MFVATDEEWSRVRGHDTRAFALTYVWHDRNTGQIVDGDIEVNESRGIVQICPDAASCDRATAVDFGNVITHEVGHYFGIGHTTAEHLEATMYANAPFGEIQKRDLDPDDIDAICSTYPPGHFDGQACDPTPQNGLGLDCQPPSCGCAAPGVGSHGASIAALLAGLALLIARRRR
jgi:MYXO-CTERM domain-containing protein